MRPFTPVYLLAAAVLFGSGQVRAGLVSHYAFEGDGSSSTGAGDGTVGASVSFVAGQLGDAMSTGVSGTVPANAITVPRATAFDPAGGDFSIAFWVKRSQGDTSNADGIFDALNSTGTGYQANFRSSDDLNKMGFRLDDNADNFVLVVDPIQLSDTADWHHFALTVDRTANLARIYRDGTQAVSVNIAALTGAISPDKDLHIGGLNGSSGNGLDGALDELRFYDHVLSVAEVTALADDDGGGGGDPLSDPVSISPTQNIITDILQVTLATTLAGTTIRYTVNGGDPTATSPEYLQPIDLSDTAEVRARAFEDGKLPGPVAARAFYKPPARRPNIIVIAGDGVGYGDLACYGNPVIATPHIDRLAAEGMRFTQAYAASPFSSGARFGLLAGRDPLRSGFAPELDPDATLGLHPREWTLAEALGKSGYATALFGTWHLGDNSSGFLPTTQGFAEFSGLPYPHRYSPPTWPPLPLYEGDAVVATDPDLAQLSTDQTARAVQFLETEKDSPFFLFMPLAAPANPLPAGGGSSLRGAFGDAVETLDATVGQILATLEANTITDTLIVFTSLQGPELAGGIAGGRAGALRDGYSSTWEGGVRVPLVAWWPGQIAPGQTCQAPVSQLDIYPTFLSFAGAVLPPDRPLDGINLYPLLAGEEDWPAERTLFLPGPSSIHAVRKGVLKLNRMMTSATGTNHFPGSSVTLFDLENDPGEQYDLAADRPDVVAELSAAITTRESEIAAEGTLATLPPRELLLGDPSYAFSADSLEITFRRPFDTSDGQYVAEASTDLLLWDDITLLGSETVYLGDGTESTVFDIGLSSLPRQFFRIHTHGE